MGAMIFGLLTGLFPFYTEWDMHTIEDIISEGTRPYIDPRYKTRSYIEGRLVEIMEQCWENLPENRVSIFDVVAHLQETQRGVEERKKSGNIDWDTTPAGILPKLGEKYPVKTYRAHIPREKPSEDEQSEGEGNET